MKTQYIKEEKFFVESLFVDDTKAKVSVFDPGKRGLRRTKKILSCDFSIKMSIERPT